MLCPHTASLGGGGAYEARVNVALNNTFGFGGHNVSLVFKRFA